MGRKKLVKGITFKEYRRNITQEEIPFLLDMIHSSMMIGNKKLYMRKLLYLLEGISFNFDVRDIRILEVAIKKIMHGWDFRHRMKLLDIESEKIKSRLTPKDIKELKKRGIEVK